MESDISFINTWCWFALWKSYLVPQNACYLFTMTFVSLKEHHRHENYVKLYLPTIHPSANRDKSFLQVMQLQNIMEEAWQCSGMLQLLLVTLCTNSHPSVNIRICNHKGFNPVMLIIKTNFRNLTILCPIPNNSKHYLPYLFIITGQWLDIPLSAWRPGTKRS